MRRALLCSLSLLICGSWANPARTQEWGNLRGQVLFAGQPPEPQKLKITKDEEECCKHNLVDESIRVNAENHGLQNVVVYLYPAANQKVPVHPDIDVQRETEPELDNNACRFAPRVVLLRTGQNLLVGNSDPIGHNVMVDTQRNPPLNVTIPSGGSIKKAFDAEERMPVPVSCSIHPWMRGWLLIRDCPYMAITDEHGRFEMRNLPVGKWEFVFWHERAAFLTEVKVNDQKRQWRRGRVELTIPAGELDLGVIEVAADHFK